ncbi:hypothetical protein NE235_14445 [Actinoallomurus spadix]|uniref:hypothetical protein n=1 Tax=Actinoallomurus spadix TaxID=79912 RepID=UPI002093031D|nr:hypothetical protein [Actinoallomurus spadix]MCO5987303.1 hypothetical protein [Actinoallomurus spadix]
MTTASALVVLSATGCGSSDEPKPAGSPAGTPAATASPSAGTAAGGVARPGTALKIGQPALVDFTYNDKKGRLQITVTAIQKGTHSDLARLNLDAKAKKMVPYYIRSTIKNAGTTDLSLTMPPEPRGLLASGDETRALKVLGTFTTCDSYPKTHTFRPGKSYKSCSPVLAARGADVTGAVWSNDPYSGDEGVTWKR